MCRICEPSQIRFITPITKAEATRLTTKCPECGGLAIDINSFPSLIKNWKVFTKHTHYTIDGDDNLDYYCLIIV